MPRIAFALVALLALVALPFAASAAPTPGQLSMSTERVVVFKDGYGLFTKVATATANGEGRVFTDQVPDAAVLGSFWALAEGNKIVGMRAEWDEQREERERITATLTTLEILRANPGKSVTLVYGVDKEKETYAGTLVEVLESMPRPTPTPVPGTMTGPIGETVRALEPIGGQLLVLDSTAGRVVLPIAGIRTVTGKDLVTRITKREEVVTRSKKLSFDLGKESAGKSVKLRVFYFTPGIRWIPTYRIGGDLDGGKAEIALQGEILNEEEDLIDAAIDLVVGVPNFRFKGTISPLSLEKVMQNALAQAAPQLMGQMSMGNDFSNASFRSRGSEYHNESDGDSTPMAEGGEPELPAELTAAAAQDHFVYSVKSLSLKKGGRATVPLWQTNAPVRHLYTLDVGVVRSGESYTKYASLGSGYPAGRSPMRMQKNEVWHQLELGNPGSIPWTTGAAFVTSGVMPVAQELLGYTPAGGRTLLPVTIAPDIRGEYEEEEIERRASARKWNTVTYAQIRKKGTVKVKNHRKEKATMQVRVQVGGKAESATHAGRIRLDEHRATDWNGYAETLNNHSEVTWELTLNPGETRELDYTFSFYAR